MSGILASGKNTPVILSRQRSDPTSAPPPTIHGAEVRYIDYTSKPSLISALSDVETLINVIKIPGPDWPTQQIALLDAAKEAGVKRFAPAEFEAGPAASGLVTVTASKADVWAACEASGLECARFCCGMFMNYLVLGVGGGVERDLGHGLVDWPIIWDVGGWRAELPVKGSGEQEGKEMYPRVTMTEIGDIGRFVAAACELPLGMWESTMGMEGETVRVDEVLKVLEEKAGKGKWQVSTVTERELQERADRIEGVGTTRKEVVDKLVAQMEVMILKDEEDMGVIRPTINKLCPQVKPTSVEEYVAKVFAGST